MRWYTESDLKRSFWGSRLFYAFLVVAAFAGWASWRSSQPRYAFIGDAPPVLGPMQMSSPWPGYPDWIETGYAVKRPFADVIAAADLQLLANGWQKSKNIPTLVQYEELGQQQRLVNIEKNVSIPGHTRGGFPVPGRKALGWVGIIIREPKDRLDFWEMTKAWFGRLFTGAA